MSKSLILSDPQAVFVDDFRNIKNAAFIGGFGSGKTWAGCIDNLRFINENPKSPTGYFAPTHPLIKDIYYPTIEEAAFALGMKCSIKLNDKEVHFYRGRRWYGVTLCRSMERPDNLIGFKIARAHIDEIDTLPMDKAENASRKILGRLRFKIDGVKNCMRYTTTPEGFRFVYNKFADDPKRGYAMVQASTYENAEYLPDDYIEGLIADYPEQLIKAYLDGEFVNLTSGTVYSGFDRVKCRSNETVIGNEPLIIGQDFNVGKMASVISVRRSDGFHSVDEIIDGIDTPSTIQTIKNRYPNNRIEIYPDASGDNKSSKNASESDISLLRQAGFAVRHHPSNPRVKDRVISANSAFEKGKWFVNDKTCPTFTKHLEQLAYNKNGEPDKSSGFDHVTDAGTYPIIYLLPVVKPQTIKRMSLAL